MVKNIFIIGSRGYHANYGGWETLTSCLVDFYEDRDTTFYVTQLTHDKAEDKKIFKAGDNVYVIPIYTKNIGGGTMFIHSIRAFKYAIEFAKQRGMTVGKTKGNASEGKADNGSEVAETSGTIFYILGLKLFNVLKHKEKKLADLGITTFVNPDGLEWMRSKWSAPVKKLFLKSEDLMLKHTDCIVCDAKGIKTYVDEKYPELADRTRYIAYGSVAYNFAEIDASAIMEKYDLERDNYCLMVGRCVPEDNYELVINEFMQSDIDKDLVIITNLSSSGYFNDLCEATNCKSDKRIKFIDGVYERRSLAVIRKNAYMYIHGHSVGGTNPSLIEALSLTDVNVLFDVCFNRDIGQHACLYFKEPGSLLKLLKNTENIDTKRPIMARRAKDIVKKNFTWKIIVKEYEDLFNNFVTARD